VERIHATDGRGGSWAVRKGDAAVHQQPMVGEVPRFFSDPDTQDVVYMRGFCRSSWSGRDRVHEILTSRTAHTRTYGEG